MPQVRNLTAAFREELEARKGKIIISQYSDINREGVYSDLWLIVTTRFVEVYQYKKDTEEFDLQVSFKWEQIRSVKQQNLVGAGVLEATMAEDLVVLLQYSNTYTRDFNYVAKAMEKLVKLSEAEKEGFIFHSFKDSGK